ncbi:RNA polymerase II elongation factor ELL-like isoform X2 [Zootoca vivipara]|uniref:RNA polymerase II elongation factor ELL-like isoform X2 n=1 Tax=Zootoca vivipara TaxID=8524 RepID=UPI00293BA652|nr:RNA polymerase II elongation factor ELL-like isoform X2 [Zootoca vivipara]
MGRSIAVKFSLFSRGSLFSIREFPFKKRENLTAMSRSSPEDLDNGPAVLLRGKLLRGFWTGQQTKAQRSLLAPGLSHAPNRGRSGQASLAGHAHRFVEQQRLPSKEQRPRPALLSSPSPAQAPPPPQPLTPAMPRRATERLSYRPGSRGARLSLFHVKLTDSALQALVAYQRCQVTGWAGGNCRTASHLAGGLVSLSAFFLQVAAPRPVIAFQGSQGYLKVPCSATAGCRDPRTFRFTFYLSRYTKEQPQASFDCVRQASTRWLEGRGAIQEKITICAMVVEASKSRWGVERLACRRAAAAFPNPETGTLLPRRAASESPSGKGKGSSPPTNEPPWPPVQVLEGRDQRAKKLLGLLERPQLQAEMGQLSPPERSYSLKEDCLQPRKEAWTGALQQHQEASEHLRR